LEINGQQIVKGVIRLTEKDVSNDNLLVPKSFFIDMINRTNKFIDDYNRKPKIVYITSRRVDYVSWTRYTLMLVWYNKHKKSKTIPILGSGKIGKETTKQTTTKSNPLGTSEVYVSSSRSKVTDKAQGYTGKTSPFYSLVLTYTLFSADTADFKSPNYYAEMSRVNVIGKHHPFGGQITDPKESHSDQGYSYSCLDYTRLLFGKKRLKYYKCKVSDIIKELLRQQGMPTNGIMNTTTIHDKIIIDTNKTIDIIQQCTNLEANLEFFVNSDGIPILRKIPNSTKGYVFITEESASEYGLEYNASDIITGVVVYGKDGELLYDYKNTKLVIKYGNIRDIIDDSNITTKAEAKEAADKLYKESGKPIFTGNLTVPDILDIYKGEWMIFVPPKWSYHKLKAYYTQEVKITQEPNNITTEIQFLDGKPAPPSNWIYVPPNDDDSTSCTSSDSDTVCAVAKPSVRSKYSYRNYLTCFENKDPSSGKTLKWNPKGVPEGEWTSENDNDFCAVTGKKKIDGSNLYLKRVSGPTPTNAAVGQVKNNATGNSTCATSVAGLPSGVTDLQSLYDWFWNTIKYQYYVNSKKTNSQVLSSKLGNCVDQSQLAQSYIEKLGFEVKLVYLTIPARLCGGWSGGHAHLKIKYNGVWRVWDSTCHAASWWKHG